MVNNISIQYDTYTYNMQCACNSTEKRHNKQMVNPFPIRTNWNYLLVLFLFYFIFVVGTYRYIAISLVLVIKNIDGGTIYDQVEGRKKTAKLFYSTNNCYCFHVPE